MKRTVVVFVVLFLLIGGVAFADAPVDGMFNWYDECGYTCYQWADGSGDCYPCLECGDCKECPVPTKEPTPVPPTKEPTPAPSPTEAHKEACNRGLGNGSEGCDPGNSGGKPGAAGEDNE